MLTPGNKILLDIMEEKYGRFGITENDGHKLAHYGGRFGGVKSAIWVGQISLWNFNDILPLILGQLKIHALTVFLTSVFGILRRLPVHSHASSASARVVNPLNFALATFATLCMQSAHL